MADPGTVSPLDLREFVVRERVALVKLTDAFDIFDARTQQPVALARETPGGFLKFLRLLVKKHALPNQVTVWQGGETGPVLFTIHKPFTLFRSKVIVRDGEGRDVGYLKSKIFSLGGGFWVYDMQDRQIAEVKGDWKGWNFKFLAADGREIGMIAKKWGGIAKELLTSADAYMVRIGEAVGDSRPARILLLAAALAIDIVFKESR